MVEFIRSTNEIDLNGVKIKRVETEDITLTNTEFAQLSAIKELTAAINRLTIKLGEKK